MDMLKQVQEVFVDLTRYPVEVLNADADLEEDLGIDSVKRGEILATFRAKFGLADTLDVPPEQLKTIGAIIEFLRAQVGDNGGAATPAPAEVGATVVAPAPAAPFFALPGARPFEGKVALVTGSGHGLGRVIAQQLAGLGACVVVNSFHSKERGERTTEQIRQAGGDAVHVWGSVAKPEQMDKIFEEVEARFGRLDFFVSNASNGVLARLERVTIEHWERAFRTNVIALHQGAMLAAPLMRKQGGGKIVTISATGARRYQEYFGCMGPVKAALESLARYLAAELGPDSIQVNVVTSGPIYGELISKYPDSGRLVPYWESLAASGRLCDESDVASAVMYLLSRAADKITGTVMLLDSGNSQRI